MVVRDKTRSLGHRRHAAPPKVQGLGCRPEATSAFIQCVPQGFELPPNPVDGCCIPHAASIPQIGQYANTILTRLLFYDP